MNLIKKIISFLSPKYKKISKNKKMSKSSFRRLRQRCICHCVPERRDIRVLVEKLACEKVLYNAHRPCFHISLPAMIRKTRSMHIGAVFPANYVDYFL